MKQVKRQVNMMVVCGWGLFCVFILFCGVFGGCVTASKYQYGVGYKDGIVEKLTTDGIFYRSGEGRIRLGGMEFHGGDGGGTMAARVFEFSVQSDQVMKDLEAIPPGKRVRLHYRVMLVPWIPAGMTEYFATSVDKLE